MQSVSSLCLLQTLDARPKEGDGAKSESKPEPGRRKSARLSSKIQQASTPTGGGDQRKTASSGKKQKEPRSAGKKRSRQTSDSSLDDGNEEAKVKIEAVDDAGQDAVSKGGMEGETELQGEIGDNEAAPVVKKQSKGGRKSQTAATITSGEKATKQSKASKPQAPNSGGRVLRTRQKGMAGSKDKSQLKKIKLEESSEEFLASESQQQQFSSMESSEDKQPQQESEEMKHDEFTGSSESKRILRKRKQTSGAAASAGSSSKRATTSKNNAPESTSSAESSSKSMPTRQSKRLKVTSKAESESVDETGKPTTDEGTEELIIRVPTSVTKLNGSAADEESTSEAVGDKTEMTNDKEPTSKKSTPGTSTDSNDISGDQIGTSSRQSGDTGGQEEAPPTTSPPDQSPSKADPQPSSSSSSSTAAAAAAAGEGERSKTEGEKDKVEPPKKIDSSDLPPMIKIRAGRFGFCVCIHRLVTL